MGFLKRLGWYLVGLALGLIFLVFFLKKKSEETGAEFCYFPNCRVLKDMRSKTLVLSDKATEQLVKFELDTLVVKSFLQDGTVDFSQSNTKASPCTSYVVKKDGHEQQIQMHFSNCDSIVTLTEVFRE